MLIDRSTSIIRNRSFLVHEVLGLISGDVSGSRFCYQFNASHIFLLIECLNIERTDVHERNPV